ncbi:hypothetical protein AZF37_05645 [endosymbiont 'TC1' of Trimyema compressum]|uniref:DUF1292 domain-containing protein n=1 Tax=endosymbiont 'TC1' of Trimyema compressum TaxID=243899 RepID=UPI0007F06749|nr:DUF1292 domain-containing protein [endosymbiont 'TC1' of Trimyema compressum]AMP20726.1 hypothetical protein AZF37_05645 [endosymbiont 'TC1' of Trimyema compressum]
MSNEEKDLIEEKDIVVLNDEEGNEHQFIIIDMVELDQGVYAVLMPLEIMEEETEDDECCILLKVVKDGDEEVLMTIEDDEEYDKVSAAIEALYEDEGI